MPSFSAAGPESKTGVPPWRRSGNRPLKAESVVGRLDIGWQHCLERPVIEIDMKIGDDRMSRPQALDPAERILQREMARMRARTQRVDDPDAEIGKQADCAIGNVLDVGQVGDVAEAKAERIDVAVIDQGRLHGNPSAPAVDGEGFARDDTVLLEDWRVVRAGRRCEAV